MSGQTEPAAVEDASPLPPPRPSVGSRPPQPPPPRCHGDGPAGAHLPTGDPGGADPSPVEPPRRHDLRPAGESICQSPVT